MKDTTVVVVASAEPLVSSALAALLDSNPGFAVTAIYATNTNTITEACRDLGASVVMLDTAVESSMALSAISTFVRSHPNLGIVAIVGSGPDDASQMFSVGAHGVVTRDATPAELVTAVREAAAGHHFASHTAMRLLRDQLLLNTSALSIRPVRGLELLSARERDAVKFLAQGMTNREIARSMHVSEGTIKAHLSRVMSKWGARDRVQLVIHALGADSRGIEPRVEASHMTHGER